MKKILSTTLVTFFAISAVGDADTIHVPVDQPTIQAGIVAAVTGDTVLVAPGLYKENIDYRGKGITIESEQGAVVTFIDGGNPTDPEYGSVVTFGGSEQSDSVLSGFTIMNGIGTKGGSGNQFRYGAGVYCENASPTIIDSIIVDNHIPYSTKYGQGGGMYCKSHSHPKLVNCDFLNNSAKCYGQGSGAAIYNEDGGSLTLHDCMFIDNLTNGDGGAICNYYSDSDMTRCVFRNNKSNRIGGAVHNRSNFHKLNQCEFYENYASVRAGGVFGYNTQIELKNCQFHNNTSVIDGGGVTLRAGKIDSPN